MRWVTMLYDLSAFENNPHRRTLSQYLEYGQQLLAVMSELTIFTTSALAEHIRALPTYNQLKHDIIIVEFDQLPYTELKESMEQARRIRPLLQPSHRDTVYYTIVTWAKTAFMGRALDTHPQVEHWGWIDFGIAHVDSVAPLANIVPPDHMKFCCINPPNDAELNDDVVAFGSAHSCKICAGLFTGSATAMREFITTFHTKALELLSRNFTPLEQAIYAYILHKTIKHEYYYGDYYQIVKNYSQPRDNIDFILSRQAIAMNTRQYQASLKIGRYLLTGTLTPHQEAYIHHMLLVCSFYVDRMACGGILERMRQLVPLAHEWFKGHWHLVCPNAAFVLEGPDAVVVADVELARKLSEKMRVVVVVSGSVDASALSNDRVRILSTYSGQVSVLVSDKPVEGIVATDRISAALVRRLMA